MLLLFEEGDNALKVIREEQTEDLKSQMIIPLTPEEPSAFLLENGLNKQQYINMHNLNEARRFSCQNSFQTNAPIKISEYFAQVPIQKLLLVPLKAVLS